MNDEKIVRREVKTRSASWAKAIARGLKRTGITPNQISVMSVFFAIMAGIAMVLSYYYQGLYSAFLLLAAVLLIQMRLLCNLFDGMVAVEGGRKTASGEVFNELPDRIADPIIIISAGYAIASLHWAVELAWLAGLLSILTAYIRALGGCCGLKQEFIGPMAKQHRMAVLTFALLLSAATVTWESHEWVIFYALVLISAGCLLTLMRRTVRIIRNLEGR